MTAKPKPRRGKVVKAWAFTTRDIGGYVSVCWNHTREDVRMDIAKLDRGIIVAVSRPVLVMLPAPLPARKGE